MSGVGAAHLKSVLNERLGGAIDLQMNHSVGQLALDVDLGNQAAVNSPQQFAESRALPKAFTKALLGVRDETPGSSTTSSTPAGLDAELGTALLAMLYEHLRKEQREAPRLAAQTTTAEVGFTGTEVSGY